jgi:hypothetical protein
MAILAISRKAGGKTNADRRGSRPNGRNDRFYFTAFQYVMVLCVPAVFAAVAYFYWVAKATVMPYELDYGEGIVLWQAAHVMRLASAYAPIAQYPYIVFHYPPLYHVVSWMVSKLTGNLLFAGRLVSLVSTIGLCLTLGWTVYRSVPARASRLAAIAGAIFAGTLPCGLDNMDWALLMRVDMLGLWLTFAGLAVFILGRSFATRYAAFVLFVAAMYTKQSLIAGAIACLIVAAVLNVRQAIKLVVFTVALGGSVMTLLVLATHGQVIRHLFLYNQNTFSLRRAIRLINDNIQLTLPLVALACACLFGPVIDAARAFSRLSLVPLRARLLNNTYRLALFTFAIHFVISGIISLTIGKAGANGNYLLEWNMSACTLAGLLMARLIWGWRTMRLVSSVAAVAYLLPLLMIAQQTVSAFRFVVPSASLRQENADNLRDSEELLQILRSAREPVMSENMTLLYQAGKQVPFEPAIVTQLAATGMWDETPLVDMIQRKAFSVMLIHDIDDPDRYSPAVARAIKENYEPGQEIGLLTVYRPVNSRTPEPTVVPEK